MAEVQLQFEATPSFRDVDGRFRKADALFLRDKRESARRLGRRFIAYAKQEAPGRTFPKSIRFRSFQKGETVGFKTSMKQPLGNWIVRGTKRHDIPGNPILAFFWPNGPDGARFYFFRIVDHPGTRPNPFLDRAHARWMNDTRRDAARISVNYQSRIING